MDIPSWVPPLWCQECGHIPQSTDEILEWGLYRGYYDPVAGWREPGTTTFVAAPMESAQLPTLGWQIAGLVALAIIAFLPKRRKK